MVMGSCLSAQILPGDSKDVPQIPELLPNGGTVLNSAEKGIVQGATKDLAGLGDAGKAASAYWNDLLAPGNPDRVGKGQLPGGPHAARTLPDWYLMIGGDIMYGYYPANRTQFQRNWIILQASAFATGAGICSMSCDDRFQSVLVLFQEYFRSEIQSFDDEPPRGLAGISCEELQSVIDLCNAQIANINQLLANGIPGSPAGSGGQPPARPACPPPAAGSATQQM